MLSNKNKDIPTFRIMNISGEYLRDNETMF